MATKVLVKNVRIRYCSIFSPRAFNDEGAEKYELRLMIPKGSEADKDIREAIDTVGREAYKKEWDRYKKQWDNNQQKIGYLDGDAYPSDKEMPEYAGHMVLTAKRPASNGLAKIFTLSDEPVTKDDGTIQWGDYIHARVELYASQKYKGIWASFDVVKFRKKGKPFLAGDEEEISADMFGDDDDDDIAIDNPEYEAEAA